MAAVLRKLESTVRQVATGARFLRSTGLLGTLGLGGWKEMIRAARKSPGPDGIYRIHARNSPRKVAVVTRERSLDFSEMDREIDLLAAGLRARGVGRGAAVGLALENRAEFLVAQAACQRIGAAAVSISWRSTVDEIAFLLSDSDARAVFCELDLVDRVGPATERLGRPIDRVAVGGAAAGFLRWEEYLARAPDRRTGERGGSVVIYTSGTTGRPKGAVRKFGKASMDAVLGFIAETPFAHDERHLVVCPLYHSAAFGFASMTLLVGGTLVIERGFDAGGFVDVVARRRVTSVVLVPTMLHRVMELPAERFSGRPLSTLRAIYSAAAPLPPALAPEALRRIGPVLYNFYGATETGLVTLAKPADLGARPDTVGRALPGNDIRLWDDDGREVPTGEVGELWVKNPTLIAGYHGDDAATGESMKDGYFSVGDLARRDHEGRYFIVGRKRDMIISGGVNVYPREVEIAIEGHPDVVEAAVVGADDAEWGERVRAFVVARPGAACDAASILAHCRTLLSGPKVPREVVFLPELPKNPTGKVLKRELREWKG
jgi:fatty-acyl-CoA synthase